MKGSFSKYPIKKGKGYAWMFKIDLPPDPLTKERRQTTRRGFPTKAEAQKAAAELVANQDHLLNTSKVKVHIFLNDYLEDQVKPNVELNTYLNYKKSMQRTTKHIGSLYMKEVTPQILQKVYSENLKEYSAGTINIDHTFLKQAFRKAETWGLVIKNPVDLVKPPSKRKNKKTKKYWSYEECEYFLSEIEHKQYYPIYLLTIYTGLRRGEVLGLPERNVDFERNEILVAQQLLMDEHSKPYIKPALKSSTSRRIIDVPPSIMKILKRYIHENKKKRLQTGTPNDHGLVFTTSKGNWVHPNAVNKEFRNMVKDLEMPKITFHDLRHSHATYLGEMGENIKAISERLGHSDVTVTLDVYTHLTPKMKTSLAEKLEVLLAEKQDKQERGQNVVSD